MQPQATTTKKNKFNSFYVIAAHYLHTRGVGDRIDLSTIINLDTQLIETRIQYFYVLVSKSLHPFPAFLVLFNNSLAVIDHIIGNRVSII